jgi:signal transduction histidine kinase
MPATRRATALTRLLYALIGLPLGALGLAYVVVTIGVGAVLSVTVVGLPLLTAGVRGARLLGGLHRALAARLLGLPPGGPSRPRPASGLVGWIRAGLADPVAWRAVAYLVLRAPLAVVTLAVAVVCYGYGLAAFSYPLWWRALPDEHGMQLVGDTYLDTWPKALLTAVAGLALLVAGPWALRGVLAIDALAIRGLLGPTTLTERVRDLEESRAYAVEDSAAALRRIERDLHDGAQARLVALAMNLGAAKEYLDEVDADPRSRELVGSAHRNAKEALTELRDLARGIHPPVLDSGLDTALATLAARSPVPVDLAVDLTGRPTPAVETIAYFCVAELLTNVAKHSGATRATVTVGQRDGVLYLRVGDDGAGGARPGGGLTGLADRARTVDGRLEISSPVGGPTVVTVELPCGS